LNARRRNTVVYLSLARAAKIVQACRFQMAAAMLSDGRRFGVSLDQLDDLRTRVAPTRRTFEGFARSGAKEPALPRLNLLTAIRCPHTRACNLLRQMLDRMKRLIVAAGENDPGLWHLIDTEAALQGAFDELHAALQAAPENEKGAVAPYVPPSRGGLTVAEIAKQFLEHLAARVKAGTYSEASFEHVQRDLRLFADIHGIRPVSDMKQRDLSKFIEDNPSWKSPWTKKRAVNSIIVAFRWAEEEEIIARCPFRSPSSLRGQARHCHRPVERHEYVALMRKGKRPIRRMLWFLRHTGCRTKEARDLLWEDCRLDDGPVQFIELKNHKSKRKTGVSRKIGLDVQTIRFLRNLRRQSSGKGHVFTNCDGAPWDRHSLTRHVRRLAKRIGLDEGVEHRVSAYGLRAAYACDAIEAGVSAKMVADQLGHKDTRMVETIYARNTRDREKHLGNVADIISKGRKKAQPPGPDQPKDGTA
jgi:integrase